jgi:putative ribosome biogenesis GTPase RsgA
VESRTRLIVVRLDDADLPELLRAKNYLCHARHQSSHLSDVVEAIKRTQEPRIRREQRNPQFSVHYEPQDFAGRTTYLDTLHDMLIPTSNICLLWGQAGVGKSTLAERFCWLARGAFDSVVFQRCGPRSVTLGRAGLALERTLNVATERPPGF